jgi:hypothetical protein
MLCLSYYLLCFLFKKTGEQEGRTSSAWKRGIRGWENEGRRGGDRGKVSQTMYTQMNKYKKNLKM